ncbi:rRNA maturation RNase YbeY [candidate division WOR-3 bacterium]|nr:rRNA maturation RNase YbeY [candidate division WOR-3 bacterium]
MRKVQIKSLKKNPGIKRTSLKSLALLVLEIEGAEDTEIDITLVDNGYIQKLNKKYRKVDSPTDVLAFPIEIETQFIAPKKVGAKLPRPHKFLGDIYISLDRAEEQIPAGETLELEVFRLLVHGMLHLLGYNHSSEMEERQEYYLQKIKKQKKALI